MNIPNTPITGKIISGIRNAAAELEHLRVQIALGKAEAKDLFEEIKTDIRKQISKTQTRFSELKEEDFVLKLTSAFEHLQVQLALGKAETADIFTEQATKLSNAILEIEKNIEANPALKEWSADIQFELEKFRMKLELLGLHFKLDKLKAEYNFEAKKSEFMAGLDNLKEKLQEKEIKAKHKFEHFKTEMAIAVNHIKKAFD